MRLTAIGITLAASLAGTSALAAATDLSTWTQEGSGTWNVAGDNNSVLQTVNGNPTIFYSDFNSIGHSLAGTITVETTGDDDFIGLVVGFNPGDLTGDPTDFILIDWKQGTQSSFGCSAPAGLAVSRASAGLANNSGAWCHSGNGVTELARAATLGSTGWSDNTTYSFDIEYTATNLKVFVDGALEFDLDGTYSDGRFGFYNYSQATVRYAGISDEVLPAVPEPATWAMLIMGFASVGAAIRTKRRRQATATA